MKKHLAGFSVILCCVALLSGGCAKQELVMKDEPVAAPAALVAGKQPVERTTKPESDVPTSTIKEATVVASSPQESPKVLEKSAEPITAPTQAALDKIYFAFDSAALSEEARTALTRGAEFMKENAAAKIRVEGHCDERGSDEYNLALGEKRAKAAMNYLVTLGIPAGRLSVISYGKEKPAAAGHDESAWSLNRRDELMIDKK